MELVVQCRLVTECAFCTESLEADQPTARISDSPDVQGERKEEPLVRDCNSIPATLLIATMTVNGGCSTDSRPGNPSISVQALLTPKGEGSEFFKAMLSESRFRMQPVEGGSELQLNGKPVDFPPGKDLGVVSKSGEVVFPDVDVGEIADIVRTLDPEAVRKVTRLQGQERDRYWEEATTPEWRLNAQKLKGSEKWSEILPLLRGE